MSFQKVTRVVDAGTWSTRKNAPLVEEGRVCTAMKD
jgi:hypothetical protein